MPIQTCHKAAVIPFDENMTQDEQVRTSCHFFVCNSCLHPSICDLHEAEQNEMKHMKVKEADPIDPHSRHFLSLGPSWTISVRHQKSTTLLFSCQCVMMCHDVSHAHVSAGQIHHSTGGSIFGSFQWLSSARTQERRSGRVEALC